MGIEHPQVSRPDVGARQGRSQPDLREGAGCVNPFSPRVHAVSMLTKSGCSLRCALAGDAHGDPGGHQLRLGEVSPWIYDMFFGPDWLSRRVRAHPRVLEWMGQYMDNMPPLPYIPDGVDEELEFWREDL